MNRRGAGAAVVVAAALALTAAACSGDDAPPAPPAAATPTAPPGGDAPGTTEPEGHDRGGATGAGSSSTAAPPAHPPAPEPEGRYLRAVFERVDVERRLTYATALDHRGRDVELELDLYTPVDDPSPRRPLVVVVHGGGFNSGTRDDVAPYARALAQRGFATATVSYRLRRGVDTDWTGSPAVAAAAADARHDVQAALRWLHEHADERGLDPARTAVLGYSAGGMTALGVGFAGDDASAVVSVAGTAVDPGVVGPGGPPMLVLHGDADRTVAFELARDTCERARAAGTPCRLIAFPGVGHDIWFTQQADVVGTTTSFLAEVWALR